MEFVGEAFDGHVGDREQAVEDDPELTAQFFAILGLEGFLGWRQERAHRVVDKVEPRPGFRLVLGRTIAEAIQLLERADASIEYAAPTLLFDILQAVAGEGGDDVDPLVRQKGGRIFLARLEEDRQIAAIDHLSSERAGRAHEVAKVRMEFGRAAGDIQRCDVRVSLQQLDDTFDTPAIESLDSFGAGFDVTVMASQVASQSDIELKCRNPRAPNGLESSRCDVSVEGRLFRFGNRARRFACDARPGGGAALHFVDYDFVETDLFEGRFERRHVEIRPTRGREFRSRPVRSDRGLRQAVSPAWKWGLETGTRCLQDYAIGIGRVTAVCESQAHSLWGVELDLFIRRHGSAGSFVPSCYGLARPTATNLASPRAHNPSFCVVFDNRAGFRIPGRIHIEFKESRG
jgi:hypothetical protein